MPEDLDAVDLLLEDFPPALFAPLDRHMGALLSLEFRDRQLVPYLVIVRHLPPPPL
jgi:hypothetical protein